jgi:1-acyl-sn-glycerol-3-phosphate acyltransferase
MLEYKNTHIVKTLLSVWAWMMTAFAAILGFILQVLTIILTMGFDRNRMLSGRIFRLAVVVSAKLNPLWQFNVFGKPTRKIGAAVVISNHCSHSDAFLISHLPWEMKWVGKRSLFKIPIIGWSMWLSGDIAMKRQERESIEEAMNVCKVYLSQGVPVILFPEGTRSKTDEMLPFKDGAFRLAIEAGVPILPIAVAGTLKALPKNNWRFNQARAMVAVGEHIATSGMTIEDLSDLKERSRKAVSVIQERIRAKLNAS